MEGKAIFPLQSGAQRGSDKWGRHRLLRSVLRGSVRWGGGCCCCAAHMEAPCTQSAARSSQSGVDHGAYLARHKLVNPALEPLYRVHE